MRILEELIDVSVRYISQIAINLQDPYHLISFENSLAMNNSQNGHSQKVECQNTSLPNHQPSVVSQLDAGVARTVGDVKLSSTSSQISSTTRKEGPFKVGSQRDGKKMTKAGLLGKTTGRWTKEEHVKFIEGKRFFTLRPKAVRKELEDDRGLYRYPHRYSDQKPCLEVL